MARIDEDELIEHWTLIGGELAEVAGKRGPTRLAFALLLKFYTRRGRFPRGRGELPDEAVAYVARQVKVPASDLGLYEWSGRTFEYHRAQIRTFLGFWECTVADAGKLTAWLAEHACHRERHPERVRGELLGHCRDELIEPPSANRIGRIISSALHQADTALTLRISARIPPAAAARMLALIAEASDDPGGDGDGREAFAFIKSDPGDVSLKTCEEEAAKLALLRHIGLPAGLFADVAPKVLAAWRARAAMEAPSHLREHQDVPGRGADPGRGPGAHQRLLVQVPHRHPQPRNADLPLPVRPAHQRGDRIPAQPERRFKGPDGQEKIQPARDAIPPLKPADVDLDKHTVRVLHGKGNKATTRGFHPSATDALARWIDVRRQLGLNGRPPLFCTLDGEPIYAQYVRALLGRLADKAGIEKRVHPHGFRHTFAVELEMAGTPVTVISKLLGHSSTAVTSRYLDHLSNAQAVAVLEGVSLPPLED